MKTIGSVFPACLGSFTREYARYSELEVSRTYQAEFVQREPDVSEDGRTIFDEVDEEIRTDVLVTFDLQGGRIVRRPDPKVDVPS